MVIVYKHTCTAQTCLHAHTQCCSLVADLWVWEIQRGLASGSTSTFQPYRFHWPMPVVPYRIYRRPNGHWHVLVALSAVMIYKLFCTLLRRTALVILVLRHGNHSASAETYSSARVLAWQDKSWRSCEINNCVLLWGLESLIGPPSCIVALSAFLEKSYRQPSNTPALHQVYSRLSSRLTLIDLRSHSYS